MPDGEQASFARVNALRATEPKRDSRVTRRRPAAAGRLRVTVSDERGRAVRASGLGAWLARVAPARARGVVNVAFVSDRRVRELNRSYRRKDYATDVLSFAYSPPAFARQKNARATAARSPFLGDIVIARGVAKRQARDAGHTELTELKVLALHGLLHLLGYDHERDNGRMDRAERRLRRKGGLREGLIERAGA
jgi:probable rRNA maturation factor